MGSHKLAQACTSLFKYKLISEEAADRTVEPPPVWQDSSFFWFVGFLGFFFWLSFFTHSVKALQWPHSGCAAETCEHHCAAQEAWLSCLLAETGNMSGDPRHSFIFSNTQTTFFFFPPRHIQQGKYRDNVSVWFFCISYSGFERFVSSWQFIQLAGEFDSQAAQELQSIWSRGWCWQDWFSEQQEGQQLLLMGLALIVMGNGGSLLNAVSFPLQCDDKLFGKIAWFYQQHWNCVVLEINTG